MRNAGTSVEHPGNIVIVTLKNMMHYINEELPISENQTLEYFTSA